MKPILASLAVSAAVLLLACGGQPDSPRGGGDTTPLTPVQSSGIDRNNLANLRIDIGDARARAVLSDPAVSDEVKAVLADGIITFPEYEQAILNMAECVRSAGGVFYKPDQPRLSWRGLYTYSTGFPESVPGAQAAVSNCVERYVGYLDLFWKELTALTKEEERAAMDDLAKCMQEMGLGDQVPESRAQDDFEMLGPKLSEDHRGLYMSCAQRIAAQHAIPYFRPDY